MIRVRTTFNGPPGAPYVSSMFFGAPDLTTAQAATDAVRDFWTTVSVQLAIGLTWATDGTVDQVDPTTGKTTAAAAVTIRTGGGSVTPSDYAPEATQALLRWRTNTFLSGREVRGRTFIPGISKSRVDTNGNPTGLLTAAMAAAGSTLIANPNADLIVWSKKHGVGYSVLAADAWTKFAVLRSRRD